MKQKTIVEQLQEDRNVLISRVEQIETLQRMYKKSTKKYSLYDIQ